MGTEHDVFVAAMDAELSSNLASGSETFLLYWEATVMAMKEGQPNDDRIEWVSLLKSPVCPMSQVWIVGGVWNDAFSSASRCLLTVDTVDMLDAWNVAM